MKKEKKNTALVANTNKFPFHTKTFLIFFFPPSMSSTCRTGATLHNLATTELTSSNSQNLVTVLPLAVGGEVVEAIGGGPEGNVGITETAVEKEDGEKQAEGKKENTKREYASTI
jgi:hypothetical protein